MFPSNIKMNVYDEIKHIILSISFNINLDFNFKNFIFRYFTFMNISSNNINYSSI